MAHIQTVGGPIDAVELGPTLVHEHVFVLTADVQQNWPDEWGREDARVDEAVTKLGQMGLSHDTACYVDSVDTPRRWLEAPA